MKIEVPLNKLKIVKIPKKLIGKSILMVPEGYSSEVDLKGFTDLVVCPQIKNPFWLDLTEGESKWK